MNSKWMSVLGVALLLGGVVMFAAPIAANASILNINSVVVTVNGTSFNIWTPFTLNPPASPGNHTELLSQTGGTYNFDTSDLCIPNAACSGVTPTIVVHLSGGGTLTYTDSANHLGIPVAGDNSTNPPRETAGYFDISGTCVAALGANCNDLNLKIGYADDAHLQGGLTCNDADSVPNNCRPDPFTADGVQAALASGGCLGTVSPCIDAGVLRFENTQRPQTTPEPATLFLLGAGLLGVGIWGRRRSRL